MWPAVSFNGTDYIAPPDGMPGLLEDGCVPTNDCKWAFGPVAPDASSNVLMNGFSMAVLGDKFGTVIEIEDDDDICDPDCFYNFSPEGFATLAQPAASVSVMVNGIPAALSFKLYPLQEWPAQNVYIMVQTETINVVIMS